MRLAPRRPVTQASITSLKTKALRRTKTRVVDPETNDFVKPSLVARAIASIRAPFTKHWWQDRLEKSEGEVLVDGNLLVSVPHGHELLSTHPNSFIVLQLLGGWSHRNAGMVCSQSCDMHLNETNVSLTPVLLDTLSSSTTTDSLPKVCLIPASLPGFCTYVSLQIYKLLSEPRHRTLLSVRFSNLHHGITLTFPLQFTSYRDHLTTPISLVEFLTIPNRSTLGLELSLLCT